MFDSRPQPRLTPQEVNEVFYGICELRMMQRLARQANKDLRAIVMDKKRIGFKIW